MEHTRKMALVPPQLLNTLLAQQQLNPGLEYMGKLNQDMSTVLQNPNVPPDLKYKHFSQLRHRYDTVKDEVAGPVNVDVYTEEILDGLPKNTRRKGKILLRHIKRRPELEWNDKGQLLINGKLIDNTNLEDLIHSLVRPHRTAIKPPGWSELITALKEGNVPREALSKPDELARQLSFTDEEEEPHASNTPYLTPEIKRLFDAAKLNPEVRELFRRKDSGALEEETRSAPQTSSFVTPMATGRRRTKRKNAGKPGDRYGNYVYWEDGVYKDVTKSTRNYGKRVA
jgi:hypothetical protein